VSARSPAAHPEKPLETLILQRFCPLPAVAKRHISGYNMSYFKPVLCGSVKASPDTNISGLQTALFHALNGGSPG